MRWGFRRTVSRSPDRQADILRVREQVVTLVADLRAELDVLDAKLDQGHRYQEGQPDGTD